MSMDVCKIFLKVDVLFEDGKLDLETINKTNKYLIRCPIDNRGLNNCKNDVEGIYALCMYLFNNLYKLSKDKRDREDNDYQYVEYIMMWLGYRLYKAESYLSSTLMDFYNNNMMKSHLYYKYDDLITKKEHLKDSNLYYMGRFYQLFQEICYINLKYPKNNPNVHGIKDDYTRFQNKYTSLYSDIQDCESYLKLLNNLEALYENLKGSLIKNRSSRQLKGILRVNLKNLPPTKKANKKSTIGFNCPKCKKINSKAEEKNPKPVPKVPKHVEPISPPAAPPPLSPQPQQAQSIPVPEPPVKPDPVKPKTEASLPSESPQKAEQHPPPSPQAENKSPLSPSSDQQPILPPEKPPSEPQPPILTTNQKEPPDSQNVLNVPEGQLPNQENPPKSSDSGQDSSSSQTKEKGGNIVDKPEQPQDGQQQISGPKQETSSGAPENAKNDLGSQDAGKGGSDTEPKNPTTQQNDQSITQGDSLKQQENSGSMQLQNVFNIFKSTFEMYRSPFYNTYTEIGNKLYKKATSTLENAYDKSRKFASNTLSYLNEHLNKALENVPPSKDNGSEPPPSLPKDKQPESQNIQTTTPVGQSNDNPQAPSPTQNMGSSNNKQVNPSDPPPGIQPQPSVDPSSKTPSLNIEKGNTGINVKKSTPQLVNYIDSFKRYNRLEIAITVILIPIILGIVYKYMSSGWRKESQRKKSMKKVINSIGGKRPIQIIIKSYDRNKDLKPVINSVGRKKDPLLNIYKLMQADPVPFINVFFLLIFFVYKRKENFLEL
ncbi:CIR protein PIR protein [Plasmodium vinckei]|uniref:CIR protein PIR protein n=1 Tax=Plasmodium vinckei TaxID=5860 RepID=A0A6V7T868_PLAVN|nr:CIR protein PIR protein [Plasmodium vinckei]